MCSHPQLYALTDNAQMRAASGPQVHHYYNKMSLSILLQHLIIVLQYKLDEISAIWVAFGALLP